MAPPHLICFLPGTLAEPGKVVNLDRLDGSIDVGGSVNELEIEEWSSVAPDFIHVGGDVQHMSVNGGRDSCTRSDRGSAMCGGDY